MKNNKDFSYHLDPIQIAIGATALTLISSIFSDFGNIRTSNNFGQGELNGSVFLIGILVIPIFMKGYRKYVWKKKGLIILIIALIINLSIGIYSTVNRYNNFGVLL